MQKKSLFKKWFNQLAHLLQHNPQNRDELSKMLAHSQQKDLLNKDALDMIKGVLKVTEMQVRDIMVPRSQMVMVEYDKHPQQIIPQIVKSTHSRFPVVGPNHDEVIGILLAKDLLQASLIEQTITVENLLRPAIYVPESKRLDVLLKEFRLNRNHMAIVVDEYGSIAGLITIEDVLEQIVGNIEDEYDINTELNIKQLTNEEYTIKALTTIEEFNDYFHTDFSDEDADTIGGFVTQKFGHLPKSGEVINIPPFEITVALASKRQLQLINLKKVNEKN